MEAPFLIQEELNLNARRKNNKRTRMIPFLVMALPGLIYLFVNNILPVFGIVIAFKQMDYSLGILKSPFVGLKNFEFLFSTKDAFIITRNTLLYNLWFILIGNVAGIALAIMFNELKSRWLNKAFQTSLLLPQAVSYVIVAYLAYGFLSVDNGFINNMILGEENAVSWYSEAKTWPIILTLVYLWKSIGFQMIIYLSSVVGISKDYHEAAMIDGAGFWKRLRYITLPLLKPTAIMLVLLNLGRIFNSDFGLFYQVPLHSGALYNTTTTIDVYVYQGLMQLNDISMSSAASFYQAVVGCLVLLVSNFVVRKIDRNNALF